MKFSVGWAAPGEGGERSPPSSTLPTTGCGFLKAVEFGCKPPWSRDSTDATESDKAGFWEDPNGGDLRPYPPASWTLPTPGAPPRLSRPGETRRYPDRGPAVFAGATELQSRAVHQQMHRFSNTVGSSLRNPRRLHSLCRLWCRPRAASDSGRQARLPPGVRLFGVRGSSMHAPSQI
jgi:hypothetical protein